MRAPSAGVFKVWFLGLGWGLLEERSLIFAIRALFTVPECDLLVPGRTPSFWPPASLAVRILILNAQSSHGAQFLVLLEFAASCRVFSAYR